MINPSSAGINTDLPVNYQRLHIIFLILYKYIDPLKQWELYEQPL